MVIFYLVILGGVFVAMATYQPTRTSTNEPIETSNQSDHVDAEEPVPWSADLQVVIEDNNEVKFENKNSPQNYDDKSSRMQNERSNSLINYYPENQQEMELNFESKRFTNNDPEYHESRSPDLNVANVSNSAVHHTFSETTARPNSYNRYTQQHKPIIPSVSKIPDFVSEQLMASNLQSVHMSDQEKEEKENTVRGLVVPIGTRVHHIMYKDFSEPDSDHLVGSYYSKYEPKIIEVPSSKPVLPIVFNFRTRSSPIVTTQTHYKLPESSPKVQYFETNEPPQYYSHVVHKPIYQDVREIILPYRILMQEIKPVQEIRETIAYVNKDQRHNKNLNRNNNNNHKHTDYHDHITSLSPTYSYQNMLNKNPYMDLEYHIPYTIEDLYRKPLIYEQPNM